MKTMKAVVGANFGDEGKGLMTDFFCSMVPQSENVLNVRFNGGAQAGHTVVTPNSKRHVFNHVGAGSFHSNTDTYLASHFIINPILFRREWDSLAKLGLKPRIFAHPDCMVTLPSDMMVNQIVEKFRGSGRHGSCGVGIQETIRRFTNFEPYTIKLLKYNPHALGGLLVHVVEDYLPLRLKELGIHTVSVEDMELLNNTTIMSNYINDVEFLLANVALVDERILGHYNHVVFEGAQGLLLDKDNKPYYPNLTPMHTGIRYAAELAGRAMEVCYVTRTYLTRHGEGRFDSECKSNKIGSNLIDLTNHENEYQGKLRYGYFDEAAFCMYVPRDSQSAPLGSKICLAVTHLDETQGRLVAGEGRYLNISDLELHCGLPVRYCVSGMTRSTVEMR